MVLRQAEVYYKEHLAGLLSEVDDGYEFVYLPEYLAMEGVKAVSLTLPLREEAYTSNVLFPFFDGLIPEGWLLDCGQQRHAPQELLALRTQGGQASPHSCIRHAKCCYCQSS